MGAQKCKFCHVLVATETICNRAACDSCLGSYRETGRIPTVLPKPSKVTVRSARLGCGPDDNHRWAIDRTRRDD